MRGGNGEYNDRSCNMLRYPLCMIPMEIITFGQVKTGFNPINNFAKKYFKIILIEDKTMHVETCGGETNTIWFYDGNFNQIGNWCDGCVAENDGTLCNIQASAGTYYIGISPTN